MFELIVLVEGKEPHKGGLRSSVREVEMTSESFIEEMPQLLKSITKSGLVHQIEDPESPFCGMLVELITIESVQGEDEGEDHYIDDDDDGDGDGDGDEESF